MNWRRVAILWADIVLALAALAFIWALILLAMEVLA